MLEIFPNLIRTVDTNLRVVLDCSNLTRTAVLTCAWCWVVRSRGWAVNQSRVEVFLEKVQIEVRQSHTVFMIQESNEVLIQGSPLNKATGRWSADAGRWWAVWWYTGLLPITTTRVDDEYCGCDPYEARERSAVSAWGSSRRLELGLFSFERSRA